MLETAQSRGERAELEAVLRSGIFHRAPHLVSFLTYICQQYFAGQGEQIKEYTVGVEALGRAAEFDPKKDSIVRVEAHRLRKRLSEYYGSAGADHALRIVIPSGQYVPHFLVQNGGARVHELPIPEKQTPSAASSRRPRFSWRQILGAVPIVALAALGFWRFSEKKTKPMPQPAEEVWTGVGADPVPAEFRMLAGYHGPPFTDRQGHTWMADLYFVGGHSMSISPAHRIEGLPDSGLLKAQRSGTFHYDIPLGKGTYELHLYFAETEYGPGNPRGGGDSSRTFHVSVNGAERLTDFDPLAESGAPNRLHVRVFKDITPAADGKLHLAFLAASGPALLNAIEILQSQPGLIRPVRIVTQDRPVTDIEGRFWSADEYFLGGTRVLRRNTVSDAREKALYRGERYGHFAYHIPLAPGKYRLTLHFAETWFGTPESRLPGLGSRVFDVFANGVALLENFEIAARVGMNHVLTSVFDNVQPNAQGVLSLEFVPVKNYAEVNAIEVVETE